MKKKIIFGLTLAFVPLALCSCDKDKDSEIIKNVSFTYNEDDMTASISGVSSQENVTKIIIPSEIKKNKKTYKVTEIADKAFKNDKYLVSIELPDTITRVGSEAFARCTLLHSINLSSATTISSYAFDGDVRLVNVNLSDSLTYLGKGAFRSCTSLVGLELPEGVTELRGETFSGDTSLKYITASSLQTISNKDFYNCKALANVYFSQSQTEQTVENDNDYYTKATKAYESNLSKDDSNYYFVYDISTLTATVSGFVKDEIKLDNLPITTNYMGKEFAVEGIYDYSFLGSLIESIELPDTYNRIGQYAFSKSNIKNVEISHVATISQYAFSECEKLESVKLDEDVATVGTYLFNECTNLSKVSLGGKINQVSSCMFKGCKNLTDLYLNTNVSKLNNEAFSNCDKLNNIYYQSDEESWDKLLLNSDTNVKAYLVDTLKVNVTYNASEDLIK
ncbi:MAG: leucine-rich repeat domain-containing protein [Acholeplasmatales bacterium]|nr:leucine-rich repeat domain-containing protein [Acholeplasmatales bacterium]